MVIKWWFNGIYPLIIQHNSGKSPVLMGQLKNSMAMFHSKLLVITRGYQQTLDLTVGIGDLTAFFADGKVSHGFQIISEGPSYEPL